MGYYACITQLDHQIGRIMEALALDGEMENTYILFLSDHGELLGDHNLYRKSLPYEGSARVPFLISGPGIRPGSLCEKPVELMDVMPTLLDGCSLPIPGTVDGKSVLPLLKGGSEWREAVHGEHTYEGESVQYIVTDHDKYIWFSGSGREQYFDLAQDPMEERDRIADPDCQKRISNLRDLLIQALAGREDGHSDGHRLIPGRPCKTTLSFLLE